MQVFFSSNAAFSGIVYVVSYDLQVLIEAISSLYKTADVAIRPADQGAEGGGGVVGDLSHKEEVFFLE